MKMTAIQKTNYKHELAILFVILVASAITIAVPSGIALGQGEETQLKLDLPPPDVPQPQLFCGYCHVLTYPGVVQKGYELWKNGKHNKFGCVECHYPPGASASLNSSVSSAGVTNASHIPAKPPGHFSYLPLGGDTIRTRPQIADASCMTAAATMSSSSTRPSSRTARCASMSSICRR